MSSEKKPLEKLDIKMTEERPDSPDGNCPICLDDLNNKAFTNSCFHPFCYACIVQWSKIKPECPLCKQKFTSIYHNIRSITDYDVEPLEVEPRIGLTSQHILFNLAIQQRLLGERDNYLYMWSQPNPVPPPPPQPSTLLFRRGIYREDLWVRASNSNRRRQCSPEFYRDNPTQAHRLIPWLTRELKILLQVPVHVICSEIVRLIMLHPITSSAFKRYIESHLGIWTDHFLHEFYNYAIAPESTMEAYDLNSVYAALPSPAMLAARRGILLYPPVPEEVERERQEFIAVINAGRNANRGIDNDSNTVIVVSDSSDEESPPPAFTINDYEADSEVEVLEVIPPRSLRAISPAQTISSGTEDDVPEPRFCRNSHNLQDHSRPSTSHQAYSDVKPTKRERRFSTSSNESITIRKRKKVKKTNRRKTDRKAKSLKAKSPRRKPRARRSSSSSCSTSSSSTHTSEILSSLSSRDSSPNNKPVALTKKIKSIVHKLGNTRSSDSDSSSD